MNKKQKRILAVLALAFSVLFVVTIVSIRPFSIPPEPEPEPPTPLPHDPGYTVLPTAPVLQPITVDALDMVHLTWSAVEGATSYQVYMKEGLGTWESKDLVISTATTIRSLADEQYSFKVRGYHSVGYSAFSNVELVTIGTEDDGGAIPDSPVLRLTVNSPSIDGEIKLEWDLVSGALMYTIFRWKDGINPEILEQDFSENYYDDSVSSNGVYSYKVKAGNSEKEYSEYSNEESVIVQIADVPDVPYMNQLEYEIINYTVKVYIDWEAVVCDSYVLYRSFSGEIYKPVGGGIHSTTSYTEILTEIGTYVYKVSAVNTYGESEMSNSVTIEVTEDGGVAPPPTDNTMLYILLGVLAILIVPVVILIRRKRKQS